MKKLLLFVTMAASLLFTQCKKEDSVSSAGKTVSMTVTAGPGSKTDITDAGAITWSAGDKLYVGDGTQYIGYLTLVGEGGSATGVFSGNVTLTDVTESGTGVLPGKGDVQTFHFFYLGSVDHTSDLEKDPTSVRVNFSNQNIQKGKEGDPLQNASGLHVGYGKANGTVTEDGMVTDINVRMVSKVALAHFNIKKDDVGYGAPLILRGDNICNNMKVNFNSAEFSCEGATGDISFAGADGNGDCYVMLVPTSSTTGPQTLTFTNTDGDLSGTAILADGIMPNKFYGKNQAIEVTLEAAAPDHETVNFGTPNLNWSKYNLGVDPSNLSLATDWYGDYYAWGETVPYYQNGAWCAYPSHNSKIIFDNTVGYGWKNYLDGSATEWDVNLDWKPYGSGTTLTSEYDAATVVWGEGWRMPTQDDWKKLYDNNTFERLEAGETSTKVTNFKAVAAGYLVVKGGKNSIALDAPVYMFLPAAGSRAGTTPNGDAGSNGVYWSSSHHESSAEMAYTMLLSYKYSGVDYGIRHCGCSVRPVRAAE